MRVAAALERVWALRARTNGRRLGGRLASLGFSVKLTIIPIEASSGRANERKGSRLRASARGNKFSSSIQVTHTRAHARTRERTQVHAHFANKPVRLASVDTLVLVSGLAAGESWSRSWRRLTSAQGEYARAVCATKWIPSARPGGKFGPAAGEQVGAQKKEKRTLGREAARPPSRRLARFLSCSMRAKRLLAAAATASGDLVAPRRTKSSILFRVARRLTRVAERARWGRLARR